MRAGKQDGFTLVAVMVAMILLALGTSQVVSVASQQAQRQREEQLLQIGLAYQLAIGNYYESSPGTVKRWPREVSDLTEDKRFVTLRRHLRKAYADPVSQGKEWEFIRASDGGIQGIHSQSEMTPIRTAAVEISGLSLPAVSQYKQWQFLYTPKSTSR